jgi:hypothetical protein
LIHIDWKLLGAILQPELRMAALQRPILRRFTHDIGENSLPFGIMCGDESCDRWKLV